MPQPWLVLRGGTLVDGEGREPRRDWVVAMDGKRIVQVGEEEQVRIPENSQVFDADGMTILPGLIDCHVHLLSDSSGSAKSPVEWELTTPYPLKLFHASRNAAHTLKAGFTTIRNMGHQWSSEPPWDSALRDAIRDGIVDGPRVIASCNMIGMTASHGDIFLPPFYPMRPIRVADGPDECRKAVREQVRAGADFIKTITSGGGVLGWGDQPEWRNYTLEEIQAITDEAHALGRPVAAHAVGEEGIKNAILGGVDTVEHGYLLNDECIELFLEHKTYLIPTLSAVDSILTRGLQLGIPEEAIAHVAEFEERYIRMLRRAVSKKIPMGLGTDAAGTWGIHGNNARELQLRVEKLGISPLDAILAATKVSAEVLGLFDVGTIQAGKLADILVVRGDPMTDIRVLGDARNIALILREGTAVLTRVESAWQAQKAKP